MRKKFNKYFSDMSIHHKLIIINIIICIIPVLIFGNIMSAIYNDNVNRGTKKIIHDSSTVIVDRISSKLTLAKNSSDYITININNLLGNYDTSSEMTLAEQKEITNQLYSCKIIFGEIDSIAFVSEDKNVFVSDSELLVNKEKIFDSKQMDNLKTTSGNSIWFTCNTRDFLVKNKSKPILTMGKKVVQITSGKTLGYIFVNLDLSGIETILTNQFINYRLKDGNGDNIISVVTSEYMEKATMNELIDKSTFNKIINHGGNKYFISEHIIPEYDWKLISFTDLNELNVGTLNILIIFLIIAVAVIWIEILLSSYLTKIITVPLQELKAGAEEIAGGNMELRLNIKNNDEIGQLGKSFNCMTEKVRELLIKVDYEARKKQEYELSLLQEQVKPHFLYNCLDIIHKLSEMNRTKEARRAVRKLADYYRNSLSDSKKIISIGQEIKIVEDYLALQLIRYSDLFTFRVEVEDDIMEMYIPKLTLQPLVENCIYHGLKYKEQTGSILITGVRKDEDIILSVADNGIGMDKDKINSLLKNDPMGHFGVYSVNHRIKLLFGKKYGVEVNSELGIGTKVDITLPAKKEDIIDYEK